MTRLRNLLLATVLSPVFAMQTASAITITETFDSAPAGWTGSGNTTAPQNFDWTSSNNAGGTAGEIGGTFSRATLGRFDTSVGSIDLSTDGFTISGRGALGGDSNGNSILTYFSDATSLAWVPDNYIGLRSDSGDVYATFAAGGAAGPTEFLMGSPGFGGSWTFTITFDPAANLGNGTLAYSFNGGATVTQNLAGGVKDAFANLNRFGLISLSTGGGEVVNAWYDNVSYTSALPEPSAHLLLLMAALLGTRWRRFR